MNQNITDPILTAEAAAEYLLLTKGTLAKKRLDGSGPAYHKLGRRIGYRKSALEAWLAGREFQNTSQYVTSSPAA